MNSKIKNLGNLSEDEKLKTCWAIDSLSGSRFKEWIENPVKFLNQQDKGVSGESSFDEIQKEKMSFGNLIEEFIVSCWSEKNKDKFRVEVDKSTFQLEGTNCFANIDATAIDNENNGWIVEIKNTETDNLEILFDRYKYQLLYYSWFFKCKNVVLVALINGWKLREKFHTFSESDWDYVEENVWRFEKKQPQFVEKYVVDDVEIKKQISFIEKFQPSSKQNLKTIELYKKNIMEFLNANKQKFKNVRGNYLYYSISERKAPKTLDKEKLNEFLNVYNKKLEDFEFNKPPLKILKETKF